jgi:hypothetical protein
MAGPDHAGENFNRNLNGDVCDYLGIARNVQLFLAAGHVLSGCGCWFIGQLFPEFLSDALIISEAQMTRKTNARLAGFMFLFYIVTGIASLILSKQVTGGAQGAAAKLASMAQHATTVRLTVLLTLCGFVSAVVLGVTLYALTRDEDRDLALLGLCFRVTEGVNGVTSAVRMMGLLSFAITTTAAAAPNGAANALGGLLMNQGDWSGNISAICFVLGSTIFSYLFLRARSIPLWLAWLGVIASVLLLLALPLGLVGGFNVPFLLWIPMLVFEVAFALWLMIKGVAAPANPLTLQQ